MVDMKIIWKAQLYLCKAIAEDIVKHNGSKEICKYADGFATIESPYGTRGGENGNGFIRVNFGEAYCYIDVDENDKPTGDIGWNNDEMGVENDYTYDGTVSDLNNMSIEEAYKECEYIDCYEEYEGREKEYSKLLEYIPYK